MGWVGRICPIAVACVVACGRLHFEPIDTGAADAADASNAEPVPGPIGWWKLDDGSSTIAADATGRGNFGQISTGISWVAGRVGGGALMPGTLDETIDLGDPNLFHLAGSMTLAAWVNPSGFSSMNGTDEVIIGRDDYSRGESGWSLKGTEDCGPETFAIQLAITASSIVARCSRTTPSTGVWYHVAGVYDAAGSELHIYVDGALDDGTLTATVPSAQHAPATTVHTQIGDVNPLNAQDIGGNNPFIGVVDDVRIYDRALSAGEVAQLAAQ